MPPFPADEGGAVLSATISRYAFASLHAREDREIRVDSLDFATGIKFGIDEPVAAAIERAHVMAVQDALT